MSLLPICWHERCSVHIDRHEVHRLRFHIHVHAAPARLAKSVGSEFAPKAVFGEVIEPCVENHILTLRIDHMVSIACADGAVAVADSVFCQRWNADGEAHCPTMAIAIVSFENSVRNTQSHAAKVCQR